MLDEIAQNVVTQTLAMQSPLDYAYEVIMFFYIMAVASDVRTSNKTMIYGFSLTMIRAFASLYFVVPLILGKVSNAEFLGELDSYTKFYAVVVVAAFLIERFVPNAYRNHLETPKMLAYAIFTANAVANGVEQGAGAASGTNFAPILVGFLAVTGSRIIENGVTSAFTGRDYDNDMLLAVFGPVMYMFFTGAYSDDVNMPTTAARALLVVFRLSADYFEYNEVLAYVDHVRKNFLGNVQTAVTSMKRRRSS